MPPVLTRVRDAGRRVVTSVSVGITPVTVVGVLLGLGGCLAILNATAHEARPFAFAGRQVLWLAAAMCGMVLAAALPAGFYRRAVIGVALAAYLPLWGVLYFGVRVNGMHGWFSWDSLFVQPSEIAKPVFVLALAYVLQVTENRRREFLRGFLPVLVLLALWAVPLALEPDFGAVLVYGLTCAAVVWGAGGRLLHIGLSAVAAVPLAAGVLVWKPYVLQRVQGFLQTERYADSLGWHIVQFERTVVSGGVLGQSLGRGPWTQLFLPLGYSDSVFATLAEAIGFCGVVPLILLIVVWGVYGFRRVRAAPDTFTASAILGLVTMLMIQSLVHLSVNVGLLPPTGITFPLISYGGSSLVASLAAIGMVQSLSRAAAGRSAV